MRILNSLTKSKEQFETKDTVKIYACGITVNGEAHLGHARQAVVFDMVAQYLRFLGYSVIYARNYTDVDDKLIDQAKQLNIEPIALADERIAKTDALIARIVQRDADLKPRVSRSIDAIIGLITELIDKNHAYIGGDGVYFSVRSFDGYGKLSGRNADELLNSVRIEASNQKRDSLDFALWKFASEDEFGFDSPFGRGRPGWHIECSAMIRESLGLTIDIHGGGLDLKFPHHENEIAQSEAVNGVPLARLWMHNGLVTANGQKMSKSLNNFITLRELLDEFEPEAIRLLILSNHYSSSLDMGREAVASAQKNLYYFYNCLNNAMNLRKNSQITNSARESGELLTAFRASMDDDFNSARAIGELFTIFTKLNGLKLKKPEEIEFFDTLLADLEKIKPVLGLLKEPPQQFIDRFKRSYIDRIGVSEEHILQQIELRRQAKAQKDYAKADQIRSSLEATGIALRDTAVGTDWDIRL